MDKIKKQLRYLMIGLFAITVIAMIVFFSAVFMGTHETRYSLSEKDTLAIAGEIPSKVTLNGQPITGYRVDDNKMAKNISLAVFATCGLLGVVILLIEGQE